MYRVTVIVCYCNALLQYGWVQGCCYVFFTIMCSYSTVVYRVTIMCVTVVCCYTTVLYRVTVMCVLL